MNVLALALAVLSISLATAYSAADAALVTIDEPRRTKSGGSSFARRRDSLRRILALGRLIAHLFAGAFAGIAFAYPLRPAGIAVVTALLVAIIAATAAESLGRTAGESMGAAALARVSPIVRPTVFLLGPVAAILVRVEGALHRLLPPRDPVDDQEETTARFNRVVTPTSVAAAERPEGEMLPGPSVFSLTEIEVKDVMMPRVDMIGLERDTPWSEVVDRVRSSEHARLPVYVDTLDEVIGILFAKDLLSAVIADEAPAAHWTSLLRPAVFIPPTKSLDAQLRDFQASGTHIAIVVDEYGGTAGLITLEDVLEEIVGEIRDEYDLEEPALEQEEGRRFWVPGRLTLEELSEVLDHEFEHEEVSTVGGLIYNLLGRVPRAGEALTINGFRVVIEQMTRRRVKRVYFERLESLVAGEPE